MNICHRQTRNRCANRCTACSAKAPYSPFAVQTDVATEEKAVDSNGDVVAEGDGGQQQQQQRRLPLFDAKVSAEAGHHADSALSHSKPNLELKTARTQPQTSSAADRLSVLSRLTFKSHQDLENMWLVILPSCDL